MKRLVFSIFAALVLAVLSAVPAFSQSEEQFIAAFSGDWQTVEPSLSTGGTCGIGLSSDKSGATYAMTKENCAGVMSKVSSWGIVQNQLALLDAQGSILVRLGGNQNRMTGETDAGQAVIFERKGTASSAISVKGISNGACLYIGYTASCAPADELAPIKAPQGSDVKSATVLVNLNARKEARPDAPVVAVVPRNTCVVVDQCLQASDGRWCRAKLQNTTAWLRQQVIRDNKWPVLAYKSGC